MKKITKSDLIIASLSFLEKNRITTLNKSKCGEDGWRATGKTINNGNYKVVLANVKIFEYIYPLTKPGFFILKQFYVPFTEENYFEKVSLEDVFAEIDKQLNDGYYKTLKFCSFEYFISQPLVRQIIESDNKNNLLEVLKYCLSIYPHEFLKSTQPELKYLKDILADKIHNIYHSLKESDRKTVRDELFDRPKETKSKQIAIPPYIYIRGMYEYLYKITKYLQGYSNYKYQKPPCVKKYSDEDIETLRNRPTSFTKEQMAKFFKCSPRTIKKAIDDEREYSKSPQKAPQHLIHKNPSYKRIL